MDVLKFVRLESLLKEQVHRFFGEPLPRYTGDLARGGRVVYLSAAVWRNQGTGNTGRRPTYETPRHKQLASFLGVGEPV